MSLWRKARGEVKMKSFMNATFSKSLGFPAFYALIVIIVAAGMFAFAVIYPQTPYSDFLIHWDQATDLSKYIKGGSIVYIYYFFPRFGLDPSSSALIVNILSWFAFSIACFPGAFNLRKRNLTLFLKLLLITILGTYGYWWIAVAATVEVMTVHVAVLCVGLRVCLTTQNKFLFLVGVVFVGIALSMRMQMIIVLLFSIFMFYLLHISFCGYRSNDFSKVNRYCLILLFFSVIVGVSIELHLRSQSENKNEILVMQRSQLYIGLIDSANSLPLCGAWNEVSFENAKEKLSKSTLSIITDFIDETPIIVTGQIFICKVMRSILSRSYVWWIPQFDSVDDRRNSDYIRSYFMSVEIVLNIIGKVSTLLILFLVLLKANGVSAHYKFALCSVLFGFFMVYGLLEFNPRYQYQKIASLFFVVAMALLDASKKPKCAEKL